MREYYRISVKRTVGINWSKEGRADQAGFSQRVYESRDGSMQPGAGWPVERISKKLLLRQTDKLLG